MSYKFSVTLMFNDGTKEKIPVTVPKNDGMLAKKEVRKYFPANEAKITLVKPLGPIFNEEIEVYTKLKRSKEWVNIATFYDLDDARMFAEAYSQKHPEHSIKAERK